MTTLVSTGQITIVDQNDAKPIQAFIAGNIAVQQLYSKDESTVAYVPDYTSTPLTLTAKVYVAGNTSAVESAALLTNRKWSTSLGGSTLGGNTTLTINTNQAIGTPSTTYFFEGDYTDPVTGLVSRITAQIQTSINQVGTNAVFVQVRGANVIEQATGTVKNTCVIVADLMRAAGVDDSGTLYQWYEMPGKVPITTSTPAYATKYGFRTTAQANAGSGSGLGTNVPATASFTDAKGIIIGEPAVNSIGQYLVEIKDSDLKIYQQTFVVYDVSDRYTTTLVSTSGDKLQNGNGSTNIYPLMYYGPTQIADLTGWNFTWYFNDANGNQAGFVDINRTAAGGGRNITTHGTGAAATVTYDGAAITFANNDMVKMVALDGKAYYYEVASGSGNTVTLRVPANVSSFLNTPAPTANQFALGTAYGKLYVCTGTGATAGTQSTNGGATLLAAKITVTGDEIDAKGSITCKAYRP